MAALSLRFRGSCSCVAQMKFFAPPVSQKDLRQSVAAFTVSHFVPVPGRAVTGTVDGDLVLWEGTKVRQWLVLLGGVSCAFWALHSFCRR